MPSRISTAQLFQNGQNNVAAAREKEVNTSEKASTFKEIVRPSQDPSGWVRAANLKDNLTRQETIAKNASVVSHVLTATENVLSQVQENVQRAAELAVASSGTDGISISARELGSSEAEHLFESTIQALNTRYGDRTLLAGFRSQSPAFDAKGEYLGDHNQIVVEIADGLKIPVNLEADRAVFGNGLAKGTDLLDSFKRLVKGMRENDTELVRSTLEDFTKANDQISQMRSEVGSRMAQVDRAISSHEESKIGTLEAVSKIEEADAVKVFSDLARDQAVLRAAISTSQKLLSENPADILFGK